MTSRTPEDPPDIVFLLGFMGSGKTTVGEALAGLTGWRFIDLDRCVSEAAGKTIPEIFADEGEGAFREMETEALRSLVGLHGCIVATGGGIVGKPENRSLMRELGTSVFLDVPWESLLARIKAQGGRPLADGQQGWDRVRDLLAQRLPLYVQADLRIECGSRRPDEIAHTIARKLALTEKEQ